MQTSGRGEGNSKVLEVLVGMEGLSVPQPLWRRLMVEAEGLRL